MAGNPEITVDDPVSEGEVNQLMATLDPTFAFQMDMMKIPNCVQAKLAKLGYADWVVYSNIQDTRKDVRAKLKSSVGIDPDKGAMYNAVTAKLLALWELALTKSRSMGGVTFQSPYMASSSAMSGAMPFSAAFQAPLQEPSQVLAKAFAKVHWELSEADAPADALVEDMLEQFALAHFRPLQLTEISSKKDEPPCASMHDFRMDARDGRVHLKKPSCKSSTPQNPEELRQKYKILNHLWAFMKIKFPERAVVQSFTLEIWRDFTEWILGDQVYRYSISTDAVVYKPSWEIILNFEFEARKYIGWLVNNGKVTSLSEAIIKVIGDKNDPVSSGDQGLYQKYFLTPFGLRAGIEAAAKSRQKRREVVVLRSLLRDSLQLPFALGMVVSTRRPRRTTKQDINST